MGQCPANLGSRPDWRQRSNQPPWRNGAERSGGPEREGEGARTSDGREGFGGSAPGPPLREGPTTSSRGDGDGDEDERDRGRVRSGQDRSDKRRGGG